MTMVEEERVAPRKIVVHTDDRDDPKITFELRTRVQRVSAKRASFKRNKGGKPNNKRKPKPKAD